MGQIVEVFGNAVGHLAVFGISSNNSPPPLMVIMTPFGSMTPWSKGMGIVQRDLAFLHSLPSTFPPPLTLYHIDI